MTDERRSNYELHAERSKGAKRLLDPVRVGLQNAAVWLGAGVVTSIGAHAIGYSSPSLTVGAIISATMSAGYMSYTTAKEANQRHSERIADRGQRPGATGRAGGAAAHDVRRTAMDEVRGRGDRGGQHGDHR
ncbi:MAG: hypothetical protein GEV07_06080 [Streptosporangiales bacterium]|nr:hypothetical protein [Streptosporangiales bacterium]